ncbi:hypothetical protein AcW1_001615 [Taiwanofungus camphoratus]|nr:hypothetical protein AcW1_001615 [Antrodia cinnamomea]
MLTLLAISAISAHYSYAFSWITAQLSAGTDALALNAMSQDILDSGEIAMIVRNAESLDHYERQPDCFRRVTSFIRTRCGELDIGENERVKAAISMTLCELATATHHSTPLECESYAHVSDTTSSFGSKESPRDCVEALSRSAQYWSSYSGYLREVPQLCFAFRHTAREIYKNATIEKLALIRHLTDREKVMQAVQLDSQRFLQAMGNVLDDLRSSTTGIKSVSSALVDDVRIGVREIFDLFRSSLSTLRQRSEEDQLLMISRTDTAIESLAERHAASLASLVPTMERYLRSELDMVLSLGREQFQGMLDIADATRTSLMLVGDDVEAMHQSVIYLIAAASQAAAQLNIDVQQAELAQRAQIEASDSVMKLVDTLSELTNKTHAEIESINSTAAAVKESLIRTAVGINLGLDWLTWGKWATTYLLKMSLRLDPVHLEYLAQLPVFRMLVAVGRVICYILQTSFSSIMSAIILLISIKRWLPGVNPTPSRHLDSEK